MTVEMGSLEIVLVIVEAISLPDFVDIVSTGLGNACEDYQYTRLRNGPTICACEDRFSMSLG